VSQYASLFTGEEPLHEQPGPAPESAAYRFLLVDDEPNVLKALRRVFQRENYDIVTAGDGQEALELLEQQDFHLIISDYKMPRMDGGKLLKHAREMKPDTLRIMLTGNADVAAVMGAVKEGAVYRFILKPWNDDDLRVSVALALEQYDLIQRNKHLQEDNRKKDKELNVLSKLAVTNRSQLAIMLNKRRLLNDQQLQKLYQEQQTRKEPMIKLLLAHDWVSEKMLREILRKEFLFEEVALSEFQVDPHAMELVPKSFCERQWVMPLKLRGKSMLLAVADPLDEGLVEDLRFVTGMDVKTVMVDVAGIKAKITEVYGEETPESFDDMETLVSMVDPFDSIEVLIEDDDDISLEELLGSTEKPPAIRLLSAIIVEAVRLGASDIHIQPRTKAAVVRFRVDGVLADKLYIPHSIYPSIVSRLKVMAELDIAERRRPQDGRITVKTSMRVVDLRISTLPTITGEKVVMRVLDRNAAVHGLDELGFSAADLGKIKHLVTKPHGIVLATGPTGSGKTTTLYSLLKHEATPAKNYVTIEDPVEYYLDMVSQVHVREKIGLSFPTVLRSILRQDPDVILLGEIRDFDTAEVAFHAALTGHLVYSTLHSNSAVDSIARLFDLGLKHFVVASGLEGIIAQRLVRSICGDCVEPVETPDTDLVAQLGPRFESAQFRYFRGKGCSRCSFTGYRGRIALLEVLVPDNAMRELIAAGGSIMDIRKAVQNHGHVSLIEDAAHKVREGLTTPEEVLRVMGSQLSVSESGKI